MQTMAQMGYQEQIPAAALFPAQNEKKSNCTPHHSKRFHVRFHDFVEICKGDGACADVLRYFEMQTDWLIDQLRKAHRMAEGHIPDPDDLWISSSYRDVSEGICHSQSHTTCGDRIDDLIVLGFLERRFIARAVDVEERPTVTFYEDRDGVFLVVDDRWGNYCDGNGEPRNAVEEGYLIIEWQYRYCIDKVNKSLAGAFLDPPKPMKRWPPIVKRRDPVPQEGNGATAPTDCDPSSADSASDNQRNPSQTLPQGGTSKAEVCEEESGHFHHNVDSEGMSTIHTDIGMNIPISSAISQTFLGNSKEAEAYREAPWGPETLIGLARLRHRPRLFKVNGDDADHEAAEKIIGETAALGLSPQASWLRIDLHIMAMMDGPTWYAKRNRKNNLVFTLDHVARNWHTVETELKAEAWSPPDMVPYYGPSLDREETSAYPAGYAEQDLASDPLPPEEDVDIPEPALVRVGGMIPSYADNLLAKIYGQYPSLSACIEAVAPYKRVIRIEYEPDAWFAIERPSDWNRPSEETKRLIEMAVAASQSTKEGERSDACLAEAGHQLAGDQAWDDHRGARSPDNRDGPQVPDDHLRLQDT